jgi:RND family efflux transporter MFP subunit
MMKRKLLPIGIILLGIVFVVVLGGFRKKPKKEELGVKIPIVKVRTFKPQNEIIYLNGSGTVAPEKSVNLIPQVAGQIVEVNENMKVGNFFEKGAILFKIDPTDYNLRLRSAEAMVLQQEMLLKTEKRNYEVAQIEWAEFKKLNPDAKPDSLTLRIPQLRLAEANLASAKANLGLAKLNLERTIIRAPFSGVSISQNVDLGQYVAPGTAIGRIYGTDKAQITIPVKTSEVEWLEINSNVMLKNNRQTWNARLIRKEATLDILSRMTNLIVEIDKPLDQNLTFGTFVDAEIEGKTFENIIKIPRFILRNDDQVLIVKDNKINFNTIEILKISDDEIYVKSGLNADDKVVVSRIDIATENMQVKVER